MAKKVIHSSHAPTPISAYSQGVQAGGFIFLSGQLPLDPSTGQLLQGTPAEELQRIMENLGAVLRQAGADFTDVVRVSIYLTHLGDFAAFNEAYSRYFPKDPPARTTVQVAALPLGARIEIDFVAYKA